MVVVVLFHALLALLPWQSWAQGPQILGVGGNLTVYSPDFVNVQASAGNVTLQSSEYVNIVSPSMTLSGTLTVSSIAPSWGNLTLTAEDSIVVQGASLAFSAPAIVLSGTTVSSSTTNITLVATQAATLQGTNVYLNGPVHVTGTVSSGANVLALTSTQSISVTSPTINVIAPAVNVQGILSAPTVSVSGNLSLLATQAVSVQGTSISLGAPLKISGWIDAGGAAMSLTSDENISLNASTITLTTTGGNISMTANQLLMLKGTSIILNGPVQTVGNLSISAPAGAISLAAPVINVQGQLVVTPAAGSSIAVYTTDELITAWSNLQGQPLTSPVVIQLMAGVFTTTNANNIINFSDQPYASYITIQGDPNDSTVVQVQASLLIANVQKLTIKYINFVCASSNNQWPALNVVSGASVIVSNSNFGNYNYLPDIYKSSLGVINPAPPSILVQNTLISDPTSGIGCFGAVCTFVEVTIANAQSDGIVVANNGRVIGNAVSISGVGASAISVAFASACFLTNTTLSGSSGVAVQYGSSMNLVTGTVDATDGSAVWLNQGSVQLTNVQLSAPPSSYCLYATAMSIVQTNGVLTLASCTTIGIYVTALSSFVLSGSLTITGLTMATVFGVNSGGLIFYGSNVFANCDQKYSLYNSFAQQVFYASGSCGCPDSC